jgi:hypothetical protein
MPTSLPFKIPVAFNAVITSDKSGLPRIRKLLSHSPGQAFKGRRNQDCSYVFRRVGLLLNNVLPQLDKLGKDFTRKQDPQVGYETTFQYRNGVRDCTVSMMVQVRTFVLPWASIYCGFIFLESFQLSAGRAIQSSQY